MILLAALLLDWFFGDPDIVWKRLPHPVVIIGNGIEFFENKFNDPKLDEAIIRGRGVLLLLILTGMALIIGVVFSTLFAWMGVVGWVLEMLVVAIFIAQKSLADHVAAVSISIRIDGLEAGRIAVGQIVGRNTAELDQPGICRAAIESLAENFSDGVVAPVFWYAILGLPGLIAYKVINTADSMIGHRNARYKNFGRATALFDDLVNWPAARLSAMLIAIATTLQRGYMAGLATIKQTLQDAGSHRSPNAGWPETAMATSLGIALGGPRIYGTEIAVEPTLNARASNSAKVSDIDNALRIFRLSCYALWVCAAIIWLIFN